MTKEQNDNTRVFRPTIIEKIPYKLKPNEFYFIDKKTGKKTLVKRKQETISEDKRNKYQRQQDWYKTKQIQKQQEQDKNYEKGIETINSLTKLTLPSTYIGPLFNNNGKSYTDNLISGEGTGDAAGNLAIDLATPLAISKVSKIAQTVPKSVTVYKGGTKPTINDYMFFTTDPQYASQFGPIQKYKLKYKNPAYTDEPLHYKDMDYIHFSLDDQRRLSGKSPSDVIIGHDKITNETLENGLQLQPSRGTEYVIWNPSQISKSSNIIKNILKSVGQKHVATRLFPKSITREAMKDVHNYVSSPDYLAQDFVKRNKSPYSIDIANHMYGLDESLNFVDYRAMNDYGRVFNERIKKTLPLAKQRGTLRIDKNPTIIVADSQGRQFLQNRFFEELNKVNGIHYGDPITPTGILAKKYYYKTSPAKDVFDIDPASFADRKNNTIVLVPSSGDYENMYKYTLPHEKTHIFIDGRKEAALFGDDRGFGALPRRDGYIDIDLDLYLNRPDEQLARGTQIKNYLGIVDESPITPEQLKYAAQNYVKDTGYDNNMTDFFKSIKDYKKAAKWLSLAPSVSPIIKTYSND